MDFFKKKQGILIIFSGPSGVGKSTICKELFKLNDLNLIYSISMTTRKKRKNEKNGINYFFVNKKFFFNAIKNNNLLEYAKFANNYYGTPKFYCEKQLSLGKNVFLEIEVQGAMQVMNNFPDVLSIFLMPPNLKELENRIRSRNTENEKLLRKRLKIAKNELLLKSNYKYNIVNDKINKTLNKIINIIKKEIKERNKK